jgi:hypothetical protein
MDSGAAGEGTHDTTFSEKILDFLQNFRRERTVFHFIFKENGKSEAVFQHFFLASCVPSPLKFTK